MGRRETIRTVLFDLDGTLLDTAPDLAFALNETLREHGRAPLPFAHIRPVVSHGGNALIRLGFGLTPDDAGFADVRRRFLEIYSTNLYRETRPFPGMEALLQTLEKRGLRWGVVTNKPARLTEPLLRGLELYARAACVVSGDSLPQSKPHPAPMLLACEQSGAQTPGECLYVGDAQRDIEAGRNAGMRTLVALFGYFTEEDRPETWQADGMIEHPRGVLDWLERFARVV